MNKKNVLSVRNLNKIYKRKKNSINALNNLNLEVKEGEIFGLLGPNGAGKTTTLKMLSGLLYPTDGKATVLEFNPWDRKPKFQKQFALVMGQKNQLWWDLPAIESFYLNKAIYEIPDEVFDKTLAKLAKLLEVEDILKIQVRKLSLGQRMKCEIIAALLHNPKVLFLDEPTIGLDVVMQKTLRDFIEQYNREFGATIILTTHYVGDVKELCERIIIIDKGQKIYDGKFSDIIDKYARNKILSLTLENGITKKELEKFGVLKSFKNQKAVLLVPRKKATKIASKILNQLSIRDLNIEEIPVEAIIREIFIDKNEKISSTS